MNSTTTRQLNLSPDLPAIAQQGHPFKEMDRSLVSVPVLCDAGCQVLFGEHKVQVIRNNKVIIEGDRDAVTNLWDVRLQKTNQPQQEGNKRVVATIFCKRIRTTDERSRTQQRWHTTSDRIRHIPLHPQERRTKRKENNIHSILL